jgi:tetratricopeptide (TPR) repeat protein
MNQARVDQLLQMLADEPNEPFLLYALAMEYGNAEKYEESLQYYQRLVKEHRQYVGTYYHLAKLFEKLERNDDATNTYEQGMGIARQMGDQHSFKELEAAYKSFKGIEPDDEE